MSPCAQLSGLTGLAEGDIQVDLPYAIGSFSHDLRILRTQSPRYRSGTCIADRWAKLALHTCCGLTPCRVEDEEQDHGDSDTQAIYPRADRFRDFRQ